MIRSPGSLSGLRSGLAVLRRSALAQSVAGLGSLTTVEMGLGLVTAVVLARELGTEGLGVYALAVAATMLAGLAVESGLPRLVMREIALVGPDSAEAKGVILFATGVIGAISMLVVPVLLVAGYLPALGLDDTTRAILPIAALLIPVTAFSHALGAAVAGRHRVTLGAVPQRLVRPGALALALVVLATLAPGWLTPVRAVSLNLAASALALSVALALFLVFFTDTLRNRRPVIMWRTWFAAMLRLGFAHGMLRAQPQLLLLLTGVIASAEEVGLLRVAQRATELVGTASGIVINAAAPRVSSFHAGGEHGRLQRLVTLVARFSFGLSLVGLAVYLVAGHWLLTQLFGVGFAAAWGAMIILTLGVAARTLFGPGPMVMNMLRREGLTMMGFAASLGISLGLAILLIAPLGATGAACATALGQVSMTAFLRYRARRDLGVELSVLGPSAAPR